MPEEGAEYFVGEKILALVRIIDEELYDPLIKLIFQRAIPRPDVNKHLTDVPLDELSDDGYEFDVTSDLQGDKRTNRYCVRYSFKDNEGNQQYVDSGVFKILPH